MEGIDQNPVYYELVLDSLWQKSTAATSSGPAAPSRRSIDDVPSFIVDFGVRRCGKRLPKVEQAWQILANTTFRAGSGVGLGHAYCSNYNPANANWAEYRSFWRGGYHTDADVTAYTDALMRAWVLLTDSAEECGTAAVRFDIADLGREYLQSTACPQAYEALGASWKASYPSAAAKAAAVAKAGGMLDSVLMDIDELLSSTPGFLFGEWISDAMKLGTTPEGKAQLASNAKIQVTDWASYPPGEPWSRE